MTEDKISVGFSIKWESRDRYRKLVDFLQNETAKMLKERFGISVMRDDTTIYDCGGEIIIGHKSGTTIIVDISDYTSVTVEAEGEYPSLAKDINETLKLLLKDRNYSLEDEKK